MTDAEKIVQIACAFEIALEQNADFKDMHSFVDLAQVLADIVDRYQRTWHRKDTDKRLMEAWGPVCN